MTRGDLVVIVLTISLLSSLFLNYWSDNSQGDEVRILVGDKEQATLSLHRDQIVNIAGKLGNSRIEIHDGKVHFLESPCSGKQCIHHGWASRSGEVVVCLPNRVSLMVIGQNQYFDAINF